MFSEKVFSQVRRVPRGKVTTYKEIALAIGCKSFRAVGQAMKRNPDPEGTPCYRIVHSDRRIGGYCGSKKSSIMKKIRLLEEDGIMVKAGRVDLEKHFFRLRKNL